MAKTPNDELHEAYGHFARVSDECAASADYNAFADLFTDDCTYIEHVFGEMHGREAVRRSRPIARSRRGPRAALDRTPRDEYAGPSPLVSHRHDGRRLHRTSDRQLWAPPNMRP
jgi:hypothetical protein